VTVLHVQKVSGISGSEAHLLSLLPRLRDRGWDARMLVLHESEPGAREFVEAMRALDVPTETVRMRFDLDPVVPARLVRCDATIVHTHLVHADLLGLPAAALARVPVRISSKHGFNEFRSSRLLGRAHIVRLRSPAASRAISRTPRASGRTTSPSFTTGSRQGRSPRPRLLRLGSPRSAG